MKKVDEFPQLDTGSVKLYLDDISSIVETIQKTSKDGKIYITVGGYQLSSMDEISKLDKKEYDSIEIECHTFSPYQRFRFWVNKGGVHLTYYASDNSLVLKGAFSSIEQIILAHRRKWDWVEPFFYRFSSIAGALLLPCSILFFVTHNLVVMSIDIGGIILYSIIILMYLLTKPVRVSKIVLVSPIPHDTFWKRNKDAILVNAITGVIGLVIIPLTDPNSCAKIGA